MSEVTPLLKNRPGSDPSYGQNSSYSDASFAHDSRKKAQNAHSSSMAHAAEMERIRKSQKTFFKHAESKPNLRQRIAYQCDTGKRGRIWELVDATLSVMFFSLYIWNTQYVLPDHNPIPFPHSLQTADMVLACLILIQFLPRVWLDNEPLQYAGNFFSILTWVSVFPVIFAYIQTIYDTEMDNTYMGVEKYVFIYPLRFVRAHVSVQMLFVPARNSLFHFSVVTRKGLKIGVTILFTFLTVAAWIHIISFKQITSHLDLSFYDAFWYTVVSSTNGMSTNLIPENSWTRLVILYIMVAGAIFIPTHLSDLLNLIQQKSKYDRGFKTKTGHQHVVVTGDFNSTSLFEFLREFFCQDHGLTTVNTYVVILNPEEPPDDVILLLEDPAFVNRVQYVKGSSAFRRSLVKAKAESASAAFLLAPKFTKNDDEIDAAQLMRALALKKYNNDLPLYVQVHLPENISHFDFLAEDVICIDELSMGLMAQSLVTPGFASLVVLLTTSVTDRVANELSHNAIRQKPELKWATEYIRGMQQEIYAVELSEFEGKTFLECSELIYVHLDAVLFSIGACKTSEKTSSTFVKNNSSRIQVYLNPQDYVIKGNEIGFVISDNARIASKVAKFNHKKNKRFDPYGGMQFLRSTKSFFQLNKKDEKVDKVNSDLERNGTNEDYSTMVISTSPPSTQVPGEDEPSNIRDESECISMLPKSDTERSEVLRKNIEKAKAYWDKPVDNGIEEVRNHVLICNCSNQFPENLDIFVMALRERNSSCRDMPVVILTDSNPSPYERHLLEKFGNVHFIKGSPLRRKDLYRAKVESAKRCVVLCDSTRCEQNPDTADAASLMVALNINSLCMDDCFVLVECMYRETFKMIRESDTVKNKQEDYVQALMRPSFMSGNVFTSSSLDTILCQCYYNKYIPSLLQRLTFTHDAEDKKLSPKIDIRDRDSSEITSGHIFQVDVPLLCVDKNYRFLYSYLIRHHKAVPLGLYRHVIHKKEGMRYICINPQNDCIIKKEDKVYIISKKLPVFTTDDILAEREA